MKEITVTIEAASLYIWNQLNRRERIEIFKFGHRDQWSVEVGEWLEQRARRWFIFEED